MSRYVWWIACIALCLAGCGDATIEVDRPEPGDDGIIAADMADDMALEDSAPDLDALDLGLPQVDMDAPDMDAPEMAPEPDPEPDPEPNPQPQPDPDPQPARAPAELMVYTNNIENLPTPADQCPGDWQDLYAYMAEQASKPDIFLLQQVDDQAQLNQIIAYMERHLKRPYAGVIAEAQPTAMRSPCGPKKAYQTNAIIWATDRLRKMDDPEVWRSWRNFSGTCKRDFMSRTRSVGLRLKDRETGEELGVASIHWSTSNGPGSDSACAIANGRETHQKLRALAPNAALYIFGGDANEPDRRDQSSLNFTRWYAQLNVKEGGSLGYLDPMWEACKAKGSLSACLRDAWTGGGGGRIDFLFVRSRRGPQPKILRAHTITYDEGDAAARRFYGEDGPANYSGHRSVLTRLRY